MKCSCQAVTWYTVSVHQHTNSWHITHCQEATGGGHNTEIFRTHLQVGDNMELLQFVITTTYFSFRGTIYQQKFGTAMGRPVTPVIANLFRKWPEQQAIVTLQVTCQPWLWKRYVDYVMEIVKEGCGQQLTVHLNTIGTTARTMFTYEDEMEGLLPFIDALVVRKQDGTTKLLVYRKKTYTNQRNLVHITCYIRKYGTSKHCHTYIATLLHNQRADGKQSSTTPRLYRSVVTLNWLYEKSE